jgi:transcriptional antiterminator RfaH
MNELHLETEELSLGALSVASQADSVWKGWYCVRTHARREHIAAVQLRRDPDIQVFLPRIRFERRKRSKRMWTTEALFQNYLFARFDLAARGRRIRHSHAVIDVVHFGARYPIIPDKVIQDLQGAMGQEGTRVVTNSFDPGELVRIAGGPFHDLEGIVIRAMPSQQRVAVLLDFLNRQTTVELNDTQVTPVMERFRLADLASYATS